MSLDEKEQREKLNKEQENELQYAPEEEDTKRNRRGCKAFRFRWGAGTSKRKIAGEDTIMNRMAQWQYSKEQKEELHKMMALGMTKKEILAVFYPETDVAKMREIRRTYRAVKKQTGINFSGWKQSDFLCLKGVRHKRTGESPVYHCCGNIPCS